MRPVYSRLDLLCAAQEGYEKLRELNSDMKCPYPAGSEKGDAWLMGAWCGYHSGKPVRAIALTRGHGLKADIPGLGFVVLRVADPDDHRHGVEIQEADGSWQRAL